MNKSKQSAYRLLQCGFILLCLSFVNYTQAEKTDSIKVRAFVIRSCILLTGSKPSNHESDSVSTKFGLYKSFSSSYSVFLDTLMHNRAFASSIYTEYLQEYLQGVPYGKMEDDNGRYLGMLQNEAFRASWDSFSIIRNNIILLQSTIDDLAKGKANEVDAQKRFFENIYYDDLNYGAYNFVVSTFNYLLHRNPSVDELKEGQKFITNNTGVLFSKKGKSKGEYLNILFSSEDYRKNLIRYWYKRLLNKEPSATEQSNLMNSSGALNTRSIIKAILGKHEFSGL